MLQCNNCVIYCTLLTSIRRNPMFTFDEQYKKFEQVLNRTQEAYDFWVSCVLSTAKEFFKVK